MITIIHGENIVKSRQELNSIKEKNKSSEIITLDGTKLDLTNLKQSLESTSLFGGERLVIIENIFSVKRGKSQDELLDYFVKASTDINLVLWQGSEITKAKLAKFPKAKILSFKLEPALFQFLDSLKPDNQKEMLLLLHRCISNEEPELAFFMLIRQFRILLALNDGVESGMEELDRMAPWQKGKLLKQSKSFTQEKLLEIYHKLLQIDTELKTGKSSLDLSKTLEFFIINL